MDISQALEDLGVTEQALTQEKRAELDEKGYTVLPGLIDGRWLAALRSDSRVCARRRAPARDWKCIKKRAHGVSRTW